MTRKYSTGEALLILELHPKWILEAPNTDEWHRSKLSSDGVEVYCHREGPDSYCGKIHWIASDSIPSRNDWVIVKRKRDKSKRVVLGECGGTGALGICGMLSGPVGNVLSIAGKARYRIYAVKV